MLKHAIFLILVALSFSTFAEESSKPHDASVPKSVINAFVRMDTNADGFIDAEEASVDAELADAFPQIAPQGKLDIKAFNAWVSADDE